MVKEWSVAEIVNLISLVKEYPCLYVQSLREKTNKDGFEKIWTTIAKKMGMSSRNVRRKWVSLMLKYDKKQENPSLNEDWPWLDHMHFVKDTQSDTEDVNVPPESIAKSNVCKKAKIAVEPGAAVINGERVTSKNINSNKLFLESIVDDLSSLSRKDQYDFKKKVLSLMETYLVSDQ